MDAVLLLMLVVSVPGDMYHETCRPWMVSGTD
jgi:hypothetical protein